ncbi:TPA: HNH endonuclease [Citrobacter sedlakii]
MEISKETIEKYLHYDPNTGLFRWQVYRSRIARPNSIAGSIQSKGYINIMIEGKNYYAHRLAWIVTYGETPQEIDHINGIRSDNRIGNLRNCTSSQNKLNSKVNTRNKSGVKGVFWHERDKRWIAYGGGKELGRSQSLLEAVNLRNKFIDTHPDSLFFAK